MAFSADYKDLKLWAQLTIGGLFVLVPIMLFDIFLFKRPFFNDSPIYINLILAYILTVPIFAINTFRSWTFIDTSKIPHEYAMYYGTRAIAL